MNRPGDSPQFPNRAPRRTTLIPKLTNHTEISWILWSFLEKLAFSQLPERKIQIPHSLRRTLEQRWLARGAPNNGHNQMLSTSWTVLINSELQPQRETRKNNVVLTPNPRQFSGCSVQPCRKIGDRATPRTKAHGHSRVHRQASCAQPCAPFFRGIDSVEGRKRAKRHTPYKSWEIVAEIFLQGCRQPLFCGT